MSHPLALTDLDDAPPEFLECLDLMAGHSPPVEQVLGQECVVEV